MFLPFAEKQTLINFEFFNRIGRTRLLVKLISGVAFSKGVAEMRCMGF